MEDNFDFDKVGKKMPYKVPPAFFDKITESTLAEAERRAAAKKQTTWFSLWPAMAVAASVALLLTIGYFVYSGRTASDNNLAVTEPQPTTEQKAVTAEPQALPESMEMQQPALAQTDRQPQEPGTKMKKEQPKSHTLPKAQKPESLDDVLANISDEELMLLAAVAETDLNVYEQTFE